MTQLCKVQVVYLAGGMRGNWQDKAKEFVKKNFHGPVMFMDPREHGSLDEAVYTSWDLAGVEAADIVFAYLERDNPSGYGLALEIGFAVGMARAGAPKKEIIFVEEHDHPAHRYFGMARACSDSVHADLSSGLSSLVDVLEHNL